jgi:hypothetical protein
MKRRIQWNTRERRLIVEHAARLLRANPGMPVFRAVGEAQSLELPLDRQRKIINRGTLGDLYGDVIRELNRPVPPLKAEEHANHETNVDTAINRAVNALSSRFETELRSALNGVTARVVKEISK